MSDATTRDRTWYQLILELAQLNDEEDSFRIKEWEGFDESDLHTARRTLRYAEEKGLIQRPHSRSGEWHRGPLGKALIQSIEESPLAQIGLGLAPNSRFMVETDSDGRISLSETKEVEGKRGATDFFMTSEDTPEEEETVFVKMDRETANEAMDEFEEEDGEIKG